MPVDPLLQILWLTKAVAKIAEEDPIPESPPLPRMPAMPGRHVRPAALLKRKKDQLRQMEDRRTGKTKPYAATYD